MTEQILGRARDSARAIGAELVVVAAPSFFQLDADAWRSLVGGDTRERNVYEQDVPNRRLAEIAERQGLRFLDLLPVDPAGAGRPAPASTSRPTATGPATATPSRLVRSPTT